ncbi:hypothetical protein H4R18_001456 [Coemansia javaensis]|uniref:F-box domain-containing protein n=1 Tax=Coemansia javaensis TaxID=2761396 RepID=A0A9W8LKM2_9FUNG|nr:hypothetical protein H4R18_001456 [Coemansia javaensis]
MHINSLPDDILAMVLKKSLSSASSRTEEFVLGLSHLAVCRRWRHVAFPNIYGVVFVQCIEDRVAEDDYDSDGNSNSDSDRELLIEEEMVTYSTKTNMGLAVHTGCAGAAKRAELTVHFSGDPLLGLQEILRLMGMVSPRWAGIHSLEIVMNPRSPHYRRNHCILRRHTAHIQRLCAALAALIPGVRSLALDTVPWPTTLQALGTQLAGIYAEQLHALDGVDRFAADDAAFIQLRRLFCTHTQDTKGFLARVCPATLEAMRADQPPADHPWPALGVDSGARAIEFPRLRVLDLAYQHGGTSDGSEAQSPGALRFPRLERLRVHCPRGPCPFLERAELPRQVALVRIACTAHALRTLASMPFTVTRHIELDAHALAGSPRDAFAHINRILDKAREGCTGVVLSVSDSSLPVLPESLTCTALTALRVLAPTGVATMIGLIQALPALVELAFGCIKFGPLGVSIPAPDGPAPAPLSAGLRRLDLGSDIDEHLPDLIVPVVKYLLLAVPTLTRLALVDMPQQPMLEFIGEY